MNFATVNHSEQAPAQRKNAAALPAPAARPVYSAAFVCTAPRRHPDEGARRKFHPVDVARRVECMIELIESHIAAVAGDRKYPPDFSPN